MILEKKINLNILFFLEIEVIMNPFNYKPNASVGSCKDRDKYSSFIFVICHR